MTESRPWLLAIDVGTSSLKAVIYDSSGKSLISTTERYEYATPKPGWAEIDPLDWWEAFVVSAGRFQSQQAHFSAIEVVAFTGQMHTLVLLDENLEPIEPTILWLDRRAANETSELQQVFQLPPYQLTTTYSLPKLLWITRHRPEVAKKIRHILWAKDYMRFRLTGELLTDFTEPGGAALLEWDTLTWAKERLEYIGLPASILPPIQHPTEDAGSLSAEISAQLGLSETVKVITGVGDVLALITTAPFAEGRVNCSLGTSSMVFYPMKDDEDYHDPQNRIYVYPLLPYRLLGGVSSTTGASLQWAGQMLYGKNHDYRTTVAEGLKTPPGADGLIYIPFLAGERSPYWCDELRAGFYGLTLSHTRGHFIRAVMEGVAYSLRYLLDIYNEVGVPLKEIALSGGGATTPGWPQIIADVCQYPVAVYSDQDTVTHGLYAYACQVMQDGVTFEQALQRTFHQAAWVTPNAECADLYSQLFESYVLMADFADQALSKR